MRISCRIAKSEKAAPSGRGRGPFGLGILVSKSGIGAPLERGILRDWKLLLKVPYSGDEFEVKHKLIILKDFKHTILNIQLQWHC